MTASPIAKSPLSSFSTGLWYKNIVQGTSHIVGNNPGGWFRDRSFITSQGVGEGGGVSEKCGV